MLLWVSMKKLLVSLLIVIACSVSYFAQEIDNLPSVTVSGTAEISIQPTEAIFSLDFTKLDKDLQTARKLNDEAVAKMLDLTRRFAILPRDVKTDNISVEMKYVFNRDPKKKVFDEDGDEIGTRVFKGYEVSKTVTVKLADITKFESFFGEILKTGITEVNSVRFEASNLRENKDKARDMAMKAAREKAAALAGSIGQRIGKALRISEVDSATLSYGVLSSSANSSANTFIQDGVGQSSLVGETLATFAPGAIKVDAKVSVTFLLE
jgi:uncharacterized protein